MTDDDVQADPRRRAADHRGDGARRGASELPEALFETLRERFQREHRRDSDFHQRPRAFSLTRNGHLLSYYQPVSAPVIGVGEIRWKPTLAGGRGTPYRFRVRRSTVDAAMLQIVDDHGPSAEMTSAGVADTIVRMFIEQTAAHR